MEVSWALKSREEFVCEICGSEMEVHDADGYWRETGGDNQKELFAIAFYCERK
jgi:transcription initiation factor IIE alpha subunit